MDENRLKYVWEFWRFVFAFLLAFGYVVGIPFVLFCLTPNDGPFTPRIAAIFCGIILWVSGLVYMTGNTGNFYID